MKTTGDSRTINYLVKDKTEWSEDRPRKLVAVNDHEARKVFAMYNAVNHYDSVGNKFIIDISKYSNWMRFLKVMARILRKA